MKRILCVLLILAATAFAFTSCGGAPEYYVPEGSEETGGKTGGEGGGQEQPGQEPGGEGGGIVSPIIPFPSM